MSGDDKFEFFKVSFTSEEAQLILETLGYTEFEKEYGRAGGFSELKLCCDAPDGQRMFATHAWKQEQDTLVRWMLMSSLARFKAERAPKPNKGA